MNSKTMKYLVGMAAAAALFASAQASATLINFENAPTLPFAACSGSTPPSSCPRNLKDNDPVTNEYAASDGVTFSGAYLEKQGGTSATDSNPQGFLNDVLSTKHHKVFDTAAPGYAPATGATGAGSFGLGLGTWFLRSAGSINSRGGHGIYLTVTYTTPVSAASGQIWDIDGNPKTSKLPLRSEQWIVLGFSGGNPNPVASETSPLGTNTNANSLNAKPWEFNLSYAGGIDKIEFEFIGTKQSKIGLAFDNFNTSALTVPEPAVLGMFGLGLGLIGLLVGLGRRRLHVD